VCLSVFECKFFIVLYCIDGEVHDLKLGRSFDADGSVAFHSMHCEYSLVTDRTLHSTTDPSLHRFDTVAEWDG